MEPELSLLKLQEKKTLTAGGGWWVGKLVTFLTASIAQGALKLYTCKGNKKWLIGFTRNFCCPLTGFPRAGYIGIHFELSIRPIL